MSKTKIAIIGKASPEQIKDLLATLSDGVEVVYVDSLNDLSGRSDDFVCYSNQANLSPHAPNKLIEIAKVKVYEPAPAPRNRHERRLQKAKKH